MPEDSKAGAGAGTAAAVAEGQGTSPELDADALLDGDGIPEGAKFRISASKLKEINEVRKAFRAHDLKPEQIPALIQRWDELERYVAAQQPAKEPEAPKADADPAKTKQREEARTLFFELFPEFKDVEHTIKAIRFLDGHQKASIDTLYLDAHEHVTEQLASLGLKDVPDEKVQDIEDVILKRIQADEKEARRFYYGRNPMAVVTRHLKAVVESLGARTNGDRAAAARLEEVKRKTAALPPRVIGAPPGPRGGAPNEPPRTVREAGEVTRAMLRAARSAEE